MGNQQPSPEQGKVQRLSPLRRVGYKRLVSEVVCPLLYKIKGEDIVCAYRKSIRLSKDNKHRVAPDNLSKLNLNIAICCVEQIAKGCDCVPARKTHNQFIAEMQNLNPNIKILETYKNSSTKVLCQCVVDGYEWHATPNKLLCGRGCPRCAKKEPYTKENFLIRLENINPNIELLSEFIKGISPIKCRCKIDGYEWESTPHRLIRGQGCARCCKRERISHDEFLSKLLDVNPNIKLNSEYQNTGTIVECECKICGHRWNGRPSHLLNKVGCPKCAGVIIKKTSEFISEMKALCPNIKILGKYQGNKRKILCKCNTCDHEWKATPNSLLRGRLGCPSCKSSYGESLIIFYLNKHCINYIFQHRFDDCIDKQTLPFDFYLPDHNIAIEYDGEQHFYPVNFGGKTQIEVERQFKNIKKRDLIKNKYCKTNDIMLVRIPYTELNNIENILDKLML